MTWGYTKAALIAGLLANAAAGFVDGVAKPGDAVEMTGHRSKDPADMRFKAETITVGGKTYDVYPGREHSLQPGG